MFPSLQKNPEARSISTGSSSLSTVQRDQTIDMNGPLVPEKVLKSLQVCDHSFFSFFNRRVDIRAGDVELMFYRTEFPISVTTM